MNGKYVTGTEDGGRKTDGRRPVIGVPETANSQHSTLNVEVGREKALSESTPHLSRTSTRTTTRTNGSETLGINAAAWAIGGEAERVGGPESGRRGSPNDRRPKTEDREEDREDGGATTEDVARSAFALLEKLDRDAPLKAPSALTVFRLYCMQGYSADQTARRCRCAKGTVMSRLRFIEERTGVQAERFRAMSGHLQEINDRYQRSGARWIDRRGLAAGE